MPHELDALLSILGPTWQHRITLVCAVIFLLGLLVERMWLLRSLQRDVAEIKADLPPMKAAIGRAQDTADEAKSKAEMAASALRQNSALLERLNEAVLHMPDVIVSAMRAANGR